MLLNDLLDALVSELGGTKKAAKRFIEAYAAVIASELKKEGTFVMHGLGTFKVKDVDARIGRNPATGEPLDIPASKRVKFSASKALKERVNG